MGFPSHLNGADLAPLGEVCASPTVVLLAMAVNLTGLPVSFLIERTKQTVRPKCRPQIKRLESHFRKRGDFLSFFPETLFLHGFCAQKNDRFFTVLRCRVHFWVRGGGGGTARGCKAWFRPHVQCAGHVELENGVPQQAL